MSAERPRFPWRVVPMLVLAVGVIVQTVRLWKCEAVLDKTRWMLSSRGYEACIRGEHAWKLYWLDGKITKATKDYISGTSHLEYRCEWCGMKQPYPVDAERAATFDTPPGYKFGDWDARTYLMEMRRARGRRVRVEVYWLTGEAKPAGKDSATPTPKGEGDGGRG